MPGALNCAVVTMAEGAPKVTVPGPESLLHSTVIAEPAGRPSSVTVPCNVTVSVILLID